MANSNFDFFSKSTCIFQRVVYIIGIKSGYSAAWFSAFVWGTKGREFESRYPDHFFCPDGAKKNMKPEKASLHGSTEPLHAPQVRFIRRSRAS